MVVPLQKDAVGLQEETTARSRARAADQEHQVGEARVERWLHDAADLNIVDAEDVFLEEGAEVVRIDEIAGPVVVTVHAVNVAVVVGVEPKEIEFSWRLLPHLPDV